MTLKANWVIGNSFTAPDENAVATAVNTLAAASLNVVNYGAVGNGSTDDTTALQAALTAAASGGVVLLPAGKTFRFTGTLTVPVGATLQGCGRDLSMPSLLGTASGSKVVLSHYSTLRDVVVDGNNVANIGVTTNVDTNKIFCESVVSINCAQAAFKLLGVQNGVLINCTAKDSTIGYLFDGSANVDMFGCNEDNYAETGGTSHRAFKFDNSGTAQVNEPRDIRIFGGIYEYGDTGSYQFELVKAPGRISFIGGQPVGGATYPMFGLASTVTGELLLQNVSASMNSTTGAQMVDAAGGLVLFKDVECTGTEGRHVTNMVTLTGTGRAWYDSLTATVIASYFKTGLTSGRDGSSWEVMGTGTAAHDSTTKRMSMTLPDTDNGVFCYFDYFTHFAVQYRMIRIKFALTNCSANARLVTSLTGSPWRRTIGAYGNGDRDVVYELTGDEAGLGFTSDSGASTTAKLAYLTAEYVT